MNEVRLNDEMIKAIRLSEKDTKFLERNNLVGIPFSLRTKFSLQGLDCLNLAFPGIHDLKIEKNGEIRVHEEYPPDSRPISVFNSSGNLLRRTNSEGETLTFEYDKKGNLKNMRDIGGHLVKTFTYNEAGQRVSERIIEQDGTTVVCYENTYDNQGRLTEKRYPEFSDSISFEYFDDKGIKTKTDNETGEITTTVYDSKDQINFVSYSYGNTDYYTYTDSGKLASRISNKQEERYFYFGDKLCTKILVYKESGGTITHIWKYDSRGNESFYSMNGSVRFDLEFQHYPCGQLKSIHNFGIKVLSLPEYEKETRYYKAVVNDPDTGNALPIVKMLGCNLSGVSAKLHEDFFSALVGCEPVEISKEEYDSLDIREFN